jgi:transglutaminase-like putative cysteine protease
MSTFVLSIAISLTAQAAAANQVSWWDSSVESSLARALDRKPDWVHLLDSCPPEQRAGFAYLIADLPLRDLQSLPPQALAKNVALAYQARAEVPWGSSIPEPIFLDSVLPHVSVTEPRDSLRQEFHDRYLPLVRGCKSPGEAALALNKRLFVDYKVGYNTKRLRTDQCSKESIAQGMATCTGLSIMLVEACRSVGVPARLAGIASWPGRGGNHTWVEVWDQTWHFVGAAEPDDKGLDHAWFVADASKAIKDSARSAIFAVTYRQTGAFFPLVWSPSTKMPAENVTDRYAPNKPSTAANPRLLIEVVRGGSRVEAQVTIIDRPNGEARDVGISFGPRADINNHLSCQAPSPGAPVLVVAKHQGRTAIAAAKVAASGDTVLRIDLARVVADEAKTELRSLLADRFGTDANKKAIATKLLAQIPWDETIRELAWAAFKASPAHDALRKEFEAMRVETKDRQSPYLLRYVGQKPPDGWGLVIAMHGGGNAPATVNDQQWRGMFKRYKDHPEGGGYAYVSLRAPNDTWNGFYDDAICPLVERLIRQFVILADVNPDRVYTLGASHGGYGAFVIGPKMPDRFAAVHAAAAAPTPGETMGENLRNVRFTFMVGERDTAYGRASRCLDFEKEIQTWRGNYGGYPGHFEWEPGVGHQVPDLDKLAEMLKGSWRKPQPATIVWSQSDIVLKNFYWVESPHPSPEGRIEAVAKDNTITLKTAHQDALVFWLDAPLFDLARPVSINKPDGQAVTVSVHPDIETFCSGLELRADPRLATPVRVSVDIRN